ncbi:MAG: hypothetical protein ACJAZ2_001718 [Glaciecola sp.]
MMSNKIGTPVRLKSFDFFIIKASANARTKNITNSN